MIRRLELPPPPGGRLAKQHGRRAVADGVLERQYSADAGRRAERLAAANLGCRCRSLAFDDSTAHYVDSLVLLHPVRTRSTTREAPKS
jgi:hypothetical protein